MLTSKLQTLLLRGTVTSFKLTSDWIVATFVSTGVPKGAATQRNLHSSFILDCSWKKLNYLYINKSFGAHNTETKCLKNLSALIF